MANYHKNPTSIRKQKKECKKNFWGKKTRVGTLDVLEYGEIITNINKNRNNKEYIEKYRKKKKNSAVKQDKTTRQ